MARDENEAGWPESNLQTVAEMAGSEPYLDAAPREMDHVAGATNRCANITMPSSHGAGAEQPRSHNTTKRKRNSRTIERRTSSMNEPFYCASPLHNRFPHYWFHGMQHAIPKLLDIPIWRR